LGHFVGNRACVILLLKQILRGTRHRFIDAIRTVRKARQEEQRKGRNNPKS
jgi:hypothetical protein